MEEIGFSLLEKGGPSKLRYFLFALTIFVFSLLTSVLAFMSYSVARIPPHSPPNRFLHPMIVYSPFTLRRGNAFEKVGDFLPVPVYAGATPLELSTFARVLDHGPAPPIHGGLVLVRLETKAPFATVNSWYRENFPKPYSQLRGQQILNGVTKDWWFQRLDARVKEETILYQAADSNKVRGAIVESLDDSNTGVTVFYYSEDR